MVLLVKNCRVLRGNKLLKASVLVEGQKIARVSSPSAKPKADEVMDCRGLLLLPGVIDGHVHFRDSGKRVKGSMEYKEDWRSGSTAAAAGGVTTVLDMPNCVPPTTTEEALETKRRTASENSIINYGFHFGALARAENALEVLATKNIASLKCYMGSTTGTLLVEDSDSLYEAFLVARRRGIPATVHAEDESVVRFFERKTRKRFGDNAPARVHSIARNPLCAVEGLQKALFLSHAAQNRLHTCHVSTEGELALIKWAKARDKMRVSCEVTPHHLFLNEGDYARLHNLAKVNPPLRTRKHQEALWNGLRSGLINLVASDHAPHTRAEKERGYWQAPAGVPGVETLLPLLLNAFNEKKLSLKRLVELTSENPAKVFGINHKARIEAGFDADFVVVDLKKKKGVRGEDLHYKCGWTPFEGMLLKGWPVKTFVGGRLVFDNGDFNETAKGKEVSFSSKLAH